MSTQPHWLLQILRWDLRATLAVVLGLAIWIGFSLAASDALYAFDFGTASFADLNPGDIRVSGGVSLYPQTSGSITFGWMGSAITEFSAGASVADKRNRDRNGGQPPNTFKIGGLPAGSYKFAATVGAASGVISTQMTIGDRSTAMTKENGWGTIVLTSEVTGDSVEIGFASANGTDGWGVNTLLINPATGGVPQLGFALSVVPAGYQLTAGGVATFSVGVTPVNNYSAPVDLAVSGLVGGLTAEFVPSKLLTLPSSSELRLKTATTLPPTTYTVLVRAVGEDSQTVTKTAVVQLVILAPTTDIPGGTVTPPVGTDTSGGQTLRTEQEVRDEFALIDAYVRQVEEQKLVKVKDFTELQVISDSMAGFPLGTFDLPPPKTGLEASLQFLTRAGIIDVTLSTAPRSAQRAPEPLGFWARFWGAVSSPVQ